MGKTQKKNSKGRLDRYYFLAKEKGYRARSSFKILQINEKYGHFLEKSKVVIDLCAAPGSWCQVASQLCPVNSLIIGVDIVPIKPLPNCITFQADITTDDCRSKLRGHMKTWKADTVLHDGAPNVGLGWVQDAFTQSHLTLQALRLAVEYLVPGGTFVTKIFRSRDYNNLMWIFQQLFDKVEATKPPASRNVSAEIFVVCKGFKAPKKMDPRLLDPKEVFEELEQVTNNESKVFNPEIKRRSRQGYEDGDYILYKEMPLMEWVKLEEDHVNILGSLNKFTIDNDDKDWKIVKKLKQTTPEFYECLKDLKVLGKKDFRMLIKWRNHARDLLGLNDKEEKTEIEVEELTEDQQIDKELGEIQQKQQQKQKREKRKKNEMKQKEIQRMQMNMLTDMQIGVDAGQNGQDSMFSLKTAEKTGKLNDLIKGKKSMVLDSETIIKDTEINFEDDDNNTGDELDNLEGQLDEMYSSYQNRKMEKDAKLKAKLARGDDDEEAWDGINDDVEEEDGDSELEDSESDIDSDDDEAINKLVANLKEERENESLSRKAKVFFNDSVFNELGDETNVINASSEVDDKKLSTLKITSQKLNTLTSAFQADSSDEDSDTGFELVPNEKDSDYMSDSDEDEDQLKRKQREKEEIELATVEAMTLAHQVALGKITKHDLIEEGYNRYSFRDKEGLPDWFLDDEGKHSKIAKPITKEAALLIKEKQRQLNARPIKKVMELQGRKKLRALRRLEKMKKKSDMIAEDSGKSELDKSEEINKIFRKLSKKQNKKPKVTVVFAKGANKGAGRPRGVKGRYKMLDGTLKNEQRQLRRIAKKNKK